MTNKLNKKDRVNTWRSVKRSNGFDNYFGKSQTKILAFTWIKRLLDRSKQIIENLKKKRKK